MDVLIAEDDFTSRNILAAALKKFGHEVVETTNGAEAWEIMRRPDAPRMAILDWMMPEMDGLEVCRRIRQTQTAEPPYVIMLTSRDSKEDIVTGLDGGTNDYLTKPFEVIELRARVDAGRRVLDLQSMLHQRIKELQEALRHVKTLQGILPICMYCHKIRSDNASWERIEHYIAEHSDAQFSHGLCPDCYGERIMAIARDCPTDD